MKLLRTKSARAQDRNWCWTISVLSVFTLSSLLAYGAESDKKEEKTSETSDPKVLALSLDKFRQQCQDPSKSEVQRAPQDIKFICRSHEVTWQASIPGEIPLKSERTVSTTIVSDKFRVAEISKSVPSLQIAGVCQRYQEVVEDYSVEVPLSCNDVLNEKQSIEEICTAQVNESREKYESAVQVKATGRVLDTCSAVGIQQK